MKDKVAKLTHNYRVMITCRAGYIGNTLMKDDPWPSLDPYFLELEYYSFLNLQNDLRIHSELSEFVPPEFAKALMAASNSSTLAPLERAAIVIIEEDTKNALIATNDMKWNSLASLLGADND